jgi:hypothetical protein
MSTSQIWAQMKTCSTHHNGCLGSSASFGPRQCRLGLDLVLNRNPRHELIKFISRTKGLASVGLAYQRDAEQLLHLCQLTRLKL